MRRHKQIKFYFIHIYIYSLICTLILLFIWITDYICCSQVNHWFEYSNIFCSTLSFIRDQIFDNEDKHRASIKMGSFNHGLPHIACSYSRNNICSAINYASGDFPLSFRAKFPEMKTALGEIASIYYIFISVCKKMHLCCMWNIIIAMNLVFIHTYMKINVWNNKHLQSNMEAMNDEQ